MLPFRPPSTNGVPPTGVVAYPPSQVVGVAPNAPHSMMMRPPPSIMMPGMIPPGHGAMIPTHLHMMATPGTVDMGPLNVFVGKLPTDLNDSYVRNLLEKCGPVMSWKRTTDPVTGKPKAFGYCTYYGPADVLRALRLLNGFSVDSKQILVKVDAKTQARLEEYSNTVPEYVKREEEGRDELVRQVLKQIEDERSGLLGGHQNHPESWGNLLGQNSTINEGVSSTGNNDTGTSSVKENSESLEGNQPHAVQQTMILSEVQKFRMAQDQREREQEQKRRDAVLERLRKEKEDEERRKNAEAQRKLNVDKARIDTEAKEKSEEDGEIVHAQPEPVTPVLPDGRPNEGRENKGDGIKAPTNDKPTGGERARHGSRDRGRDRNHEQRGRSRSKDRRRHRRSFSSSRSRSRHRSSRRHYSRSRSRSSSSSPPRSRGRREHRRDRHRDRGRHRGRDRDERERKHRRRHRDESDSESSDEDQKRPSKRQKEDISNPSMVKTLPKVVLGLKLSTGVVKKEKPVVAPSAPVFHIEEEVEEKPVREIIPIDYTEEEKLAAAPVHERIAATVAKINSRTGDMTQLINLIPTDKDKLFAFGIKWSAVDKHNLIDVKMAPWVKKKIQEYLGEEDTTMMEFLLTKLRQHTTPQEILTELQIVLEEDAEKFVLLLWRKLAFEALRA